jgi:hypothetical protein
MLIIIDPSIVEGYGRQGIGTAISPFHKERLKRENTETVRNELKEGLKTVRAKCDIRVVHLLNFRLGQDPMQCEHSVTSGSTPHEREHAGAVRNHRDYRFKRGIHEPSRVLRIEDTMLMNISSGAYNVCKFLHIRQP